LLLLQLVYLKQPSKIKLFDIDIKADSAQLSLAKSKDEKIKTYLNKKMRFEK
jgi:hypothetical protein